MKLLTCLVFGLVLVGQVWSDLGGLVNGVANMIPTKLGKLPMPGKDVKILGCFNDNVVFRAISGKMTKYKTEEVVKKCYERAKAIKAKVFAVQFGYACFTNKNADKEYAKYGRALLGGCTNGKGGPSLNDVYEISDGGKDDKKANPGKPLVDPAPPKPKPLIIAPAPFATKAPLRTIKHVDPTIPACVRKDRNFAGNNVGKVTKQASWLKCSQACDKEPACKAFSFVRDSYKVAAHRGNCHFKNSNFGKKIQNLQGVFSAPKGCGTTWQPHEPIIEGPDGLHGPHPGEPHIGLGHDFSYANYKNKRCGTHSFTNEGCYKTRVAFKRGKLLIYWRHDIEWAKNRISSFASSLACACAEAARLHGVEYFGIHYWGECWALDPREISRDTSGDCIIADGLYKNKCTARKRYRNECLASESYYTYRLGPQIMW